MLVDSLLAMSTSISADVFFAAGLGHGGLALGLLLTAWTGDGRRLAGGGAARADPAARDGRRGGDRPAGAGKLGAAALGVLAPAAAHGRAFAAYAALRNGAELAALALGGLLVDALGGRATLLVAGGSTVAIAGVALAGLRRTRGRALPGARVPSPQSRATSAS